MTDEIRTDNLHDLHAAWVRNNRHLGLRAVMLAVLWVGAIGAVSFVLGMVLR